MPGFRIASRLGAAPDDDLNIVDVRPGHGFRERFSAVDVENVPAGPTVRHDQDHV